AAAARARWRHAGLSTSRALLLSIAGGHLDPRSEATQAACAVEEAYLRQLTMLDPDVVRMGYWFARGLAQGRSAGVSLTIRSGGTDVGDDEMAASLGALMLGAIDSVPSGSEMVVSLFRTGEQLRFSVVGASPHVAAAA